MFVCLGVQRQSAAVAAVRSVAGAWLLGVVMLEWQAATSELKGE